MCSLMPMRVIAAAVEALRIEPAEVAHARQRDVDQAVEELVHPRLAQRDLAADRLAVAQLEGGDRLARLGDDGLLAGDQRQIGGGLLDLLAVGDALADAHVEHDLVDARHLHRVLVAELLGHRLADDLVEMRAQARRNALLGLARLLLRRRALLGGARLGGLRLLGACCRLGRPIDLRSALGLALPWRPCRRLSLCQPSISLPNAWRSAPCGRRRYDRLEADAGRLAVLGIGERHVGQMDRQLPWRRCRPAAARSASGGA